MPNAPLSLDYSEKAGLGFCFTFCQFKNKLSISAIELSNSEVKGGKKPKMISGS